MPRTPSTDKHANTPTVDVNVGIFYTTPRRKQSKGRLYVDLVGVPVSDVLAEVNRATQALLEAVKADCG